MQVEKLEDIPIISYIVVTIIGVWSGVINYTKRDKQLKGKSKLFKIFTFILDAVTSAGIAIIIYLSILGLGLNELLAVGIAGTLSHMGTRAFYLMELMIVEKLGGSEEIKDEIRKYSK